MLLSAEPISASEAQSIGLVNYVVPHEELLGASFDLAHTTASKPPQAMAACLGSATLALLR